MNTRFFRRSVLVAALAAAGFQAPALAQTIPAAAQTPMVQASHAPVRLQQGTPVRVRLLEKLDTGSNLDPGTSISFEVADAVIVNGVTVIRSGARATGTITDAKKAKWGGRKGKLDFTVDYVETVDGQNVRVRSTEAHADGKGNVGLMAAGVIFVAPVAVLIRGKNAVVEKGTEFSVYIDQDRDVQAH